MRVRPFVLNPTGSAGDAAPAAREPGPTDLDVLTARLASSARTRGAPSPRRPWPEPLPARVDLASFQAADQAAPLGWVDDPDNQARTVYSWDQRNVLAYGVDGSGAAGTLVTLACALARTARPDDLHLYAVDNHAGELAPLQALPHTGAVVEPGDTDRQRRMLRTLRRHLEARARPDTTPAARPTILFLVADLGALLTRLDETGLVEARDHLSWIAADGPTAELYSAMAATRPGAVPHALAASFAARLVFRLADPHDATLLGVRPLGSTVPAGRAVDASTGLDVQLAEVSPSTLSAVSEAWPAPANPAPPVRSLPSDLAFAVVADAPPPAAGLWLPVGVNDEVEPCGLLLGRAEHAVIAGGPRAGKTALLATIAAAAKAAGVTIARSVEEARAAAGACAFLVDDVERVDDTDGAIAALLAERRPALHLVVAGRTDALRTAYGHWTRDLRRTATGVLLVPRPDDGDLFGVVLPRSPAPFPAGRGYLVTGGVPCLFHAAV